MAPLRIEKIKELKVAGKSVAEIAKIYKVTRQAVYCHLDKDKKEPKKKTTQYKSNEIDYNSLIDWRIYNDGLVKRGELLFDMKVFKNWNKELIDMNAGKVGAPYWYPNSFIYFMIRLKSIFQMDYRSMEGIGKKLIIMIPQAKKMADYTTLQYRCKKANWILKVNQKKGKQDIAGDCSGLKTSNRGEYRMNKYKDGKKKKYVKLHIAVNIKSRQVTSAVITDDSVHDGKKMKDLIKASEKYGPIEKVLFDKGYDSADNYWWLKQKAIEAGIKPRETLKPSQIKKEIKLTEKILEQAKTSTKVFQNARKRILRLKALDLYLKDKEKWKKKYQYGFRWRSEGRYSVFKRLFGESVFSKQINLIRNEVIVKLNMMNEFAPIYVNSLKSNYNDSS